MSTQVIVTTAVEISDKQRSALLKNLTATHGEVNLQEKVDPQVLGGIRLLIGSTEYDSTMKAKLEQLRQDLHTNLSR